MFNSSNSIVFKEELQKEILQSERTRALLLSIVSLVLAILLGIITSVFYDEFAKVFRQKNIGIFIVIGLLILLSLREYYVSQFFRKRIISSKPIKPLYRYLNVFLETSVPTAMMTVVGLYLESNVIILTPAPYIYFIFIILSILNLDFKFSVFTGAIAAFEYIALVIFLLNKFDAPAPGPLFDGIYFYLGKSMIMLISGGLAGFAAEQLRRRIYNSFKISNERNKIINMFGQQVSKEIVDELLKGEKTTESQRKFVCIMFLDIRGFTPFSEKKEPEEIIRYQNNVFGFMIDIITKNHGIINQFLGDGYMATFGAPISKGNDCQNAVNAALEIIKTVNQKNENKEIENTRIGIGLHAGNVVAGNVGTHIRKQYSITGNTVILASRIEQLNKEYNSQLLISEEVIMELNTSGIKNDFLGPVQVKGRETPINIYKLA